MVIQKSKSCFQRDFIKSAALCLTLSIFLNSCVKDDEEKCIPTNCVCNEIPTSTAAIGYNFEIANPHVRKADFSPNDDQEMILYVENQSLNIYSLLKLNTETNEISEIFSQRTVFNQDWGVNDWILLNLPNGYIWKIKSDGTELTQLTFSGGDFYPKWNLEANEIVYRNNDQNITVLMDANGEAIDTIYQELIVSGDDWNHPNLIASGYSGSVALVDLNSETRTVIHDFENDLECYEGCEKEIKSDHGRVWENDNIYYSHTLGIYRVGSDGSNHELIKESCENSHYTSPSINMSKNKLLWIKRTKKYLGDNTIRLVNSAVTMDLDGGNEMTVLIP